MCGRPPLVAIQEGKVKALQSWLKHGQRLRERPNLNPSLRLNKGDFDLKCATAEEVQSNVKQRLQSLD